MIVRLLVDTTNTTMKITTNVLALADTVTISHPLEGNVSGHVLAANTFQCTTISAPISVHMVNSSQDQEINVYSHVDTGNT